MRSTRRHFIKNIIAASCVLPYAKIYNQILDSIPNKLDVSIFSKHLQFLDFKETGRMARELGFDGVDLTVRPKGHVLPDNVAKDLPQALKEIKEAGSICKMITTNIESVDNPKDVEILTAAGKEGISYYRTNWYKYEKDIPMTQSIINCQSKIFELGKLNKEHNIIGCYQNHAGTKIGASYWEIHKLLETVDAEYFGAQFDIRHATVDSGYSWTNGLRLLQNQIKVIVLKDFKWRKENNTWKVVNVPIGEGMVDFKKYFKLLKEYGLNPPVSLHLEYPLGGAEKGKNEITIEHSLVYDAMVKDLKAIRQYWKEA